MFLFMRITTLEFTIGKQKKHLNRFLRKNTVILVGGTGLYANSIINGIDKFPKIGDSIKKKLNLILKMKELKS